jgi:uncharacterized protein
VFVNRVEELAALRSWWSAGDALALVWGRRRVGKSWLVAHFAEEVHRAVVHVSGARALAQELSVFSSEVARSGMEGTRDLIARPYASWDEAIDALASAGKERPILVVLDEFPELLRSDPSLDGVLRAAIDRLGSPSPIRIILCGSAVRTMLSLSEERRPLFGRLGLRLAVHPFRPHEAARMLTQVAAPDRALIWGLVGGTPLYLSWWEQETTISENLARLVCNPGGRLLNEGQLILATEGDIGELAGPVLTAIASGSTKFSEIKSSVRSDPTRTLERLAEVRLIERMVPVTEDPSRSRRVIYRIADNFLAFWLSLVDGYRSEIERGLGESILPVLLRSLDDFMGGRYEEAFREHLRLLVSRGDFGDVVAVGRFWSGGADEIDAVCLAGRQRAAVLVGEAKWARRVRAAPIEFALARKSTSLPRVSDPLRLAVCARESVTDASSSTLTVTASDIFPDE